MGMCQGPGLRRSIRTTDCREREWQGCAQALRALGIVAAPTPERDGQPMAGCLHELQPITRPVLGAQAVLASCADEPSESLFGGMDLLRWPKEGTRVAVAILGHSELNLRLAATLADHLRLVEARRPG